MQILSSEIMPICILIMIVGFVVSDWKSDIFPHCSLYTMLVFACVCASMNSSYEK